MLLNIMFSHAYFLLCVIRAVTLPKVEVKTKKPANSTNIVKMRSWRFLGWSAQGAGKNCAIVQWYEITYK
jgi:hypothetical protein